MCSIPRTGSCVSKAYSCERIKRYYRIATNDYANLAAFVLQHYRRRQSVASLSLLRILYPIIEAGLRRCSYTKAKVVGKRHIRNRHVDDDLPCAWIQIPYSLHIGVDLTCTGQLISATERRLNFDRRWLMELFTYLTRVTDSVVR